MRVPVSWIREYADLPHDATSDDLAARLTALGLKLEALERPAEQITGPLVVGRVLAMTPEPQKNGKTINWCSVDVGEANGTGEPQGIVCGAHNFTVGDLVVAVLPGGVLPGGFAISARRTYGHVSAGMICSGAELGLSAPGDPAGSDGIVVLPPDAGEPGQDAIGVLGLDDDVIEMEINPDRAYALSARGVARDAALAYGAPYRDPAARAVPPADDAGWPVAIDDPAGCPVFVARLVSGFDPGAPTPDFMARRLVQAGMRPISLAVDVTNYVMLELGRPIHGYDADKLHGTVGVRRARVGERLRTLDGTDRDLDAEDLVVVDGDDLIGLGGVMGGEATEISAATTRVLVESAHWDPTSMFRTGRRHRITSEAGRRNERGVDPTICEAAADRVVELLVAHGGGVAEPGVTVVGVPPEREPIGLDADLPARLSGIGIPAARTVAALREQGCEVREGAPLTVTPPPWRLDLTDPVDLVEEVVRVVGYDAVPSVLPTPAAGRGLTAGQRLRRRVGRTLAGAGAVEVVSFPFVGDEALDALGIDADDERRRTVRLSNPLAATEPAYTTTLLPGLLRAAARNLGRGAPGVTLYETGTVVRGGSSPTPILGVDRRPDDLELKELLAGVPDQPLHLGLVLAGERERAGWWGAGSAIAGWADALGLVRRLGEELGVPVATRPAVRAPWHPGRCAEIVVGDDLVLGHGGELHPRVCDAHDLPRRSAAVEIDLDALLALVDERVLGPTISTYPLAKEDVALLVASEVSAADVEAALREGAGELLESIRLFDLYTGPQVGEDRKSLAFALRFRAPDRTLTEEETGAARDAAVAVAVERCGAVQR